MYRRLRVAVVIPAFNERRAIARPVATVPAFVDDVIVVDDASTDDTGAQAELARRASRAAIRSRGHPPRRAIAASARAITTGYRRALALGADVAVVMAGDGQMDPARSARRCSIRSRPARADYVKGNRFLHPEIWTRDAADADRRQRRCSRRRRA